MKRVPIRDLKSPQKVKPRVFDALIGPGRVLLDVKVWKKGNVQIPLDDVLQQIDSAKQQILSAESEQNTMTTEL